MLRAGACLLTLWSGVNLCLAAAILVALVGFHRNAPALTILMDEASVRRLDPNAIATVNALAVFGNACAAAFCVLMLFLVWSGVAAGRRAAFWVLAGTSGALQAFGFASDAMLRGHDTGLNVLSSAVLLAGLVLCGVGLRGRRLRHQ